MASWRRPRGVSTRRSIAGETSSPPPRSNGTPRAGTMDDYSASYRDKRAAQTRHAQAVDQLNLLQRGTNATSSDFYTYRYLATEGFLPGYNFPSLPLLAYVPASRDGRGTADVPPAPALPCARRVRSAQPRLPRGARLPGRAGAALARSPGFGDARRAAAHQGRCESVRAAAPVTSATIGRCATPADSRSATPRSWATRTASRTSPRIRPSTSPRTTKNASARGSTCRRRSSGRFATRRSTCGAHRPPTPRARSCAWHTAPGATITRLNKGLRRRADKKVLGFPHRSRIRVLGQKRGRRR